MILSLNKTKVLALSKGEFVKKHENVLLIGNSGTGKNTKRTLDQLRCRPKRWIEICLIHQDGRWTHISVFLSLSWNIYRCDMRNYCIIQNIWTDSPSVRSLEAPNIRFCLSRSFCSYHCTSCSNWVTWFSSVSHFFCRDCTCSGVESPCFPHSTREPEIPCYDWDFRVF